MCRQVITPSSVASVQASQLTNTITSAASPAATHIVSSESWQQHLLVDHCGLQSILYCVAGVLSQCQYCFAAASARRLLQPATIKLYELLMQQFLGSDCHCHSRQFELLQTWLSFLQRPRLSPVSTRTSDNILALSPPIKRILHPHATATDSTSSLHALPSCQRLNQQHKSKHNGRGVLHALVPS